MIKNMAFKLQHIKKKLYIWEKPKVYIYLTI